MAVGTVLMVVLLTTTPVVASMPVASQDGGTAPDGSLDTDGVGDAATDRYWHPHDRDVREYDGNDDARISYSEAYDAYEDYLDGVVTWETYLAVSEAYADDEPVVYPDPDDDGMTIREESVWSDHGATFGKYTPDIDRDGVVDARDRRPNTEDVPPELNLTIRRSLFGKTYTAGARDASGISRLEATYGTGVWTNVTYAGHGGPDATGLVVPATLAGVDGVRITAEDTNGNEQTVVLGFEDDGSSEILGASTLVGGGTSVEYPSTSSRSIDAVSITALVTPAGGEIHRRYERVTADGTTRTIEAPAYASPAVETYPTPGAYDWIGPEVRDAVGEEALPLRLPEGFDEEVADPAGGSLHRGRGWEHIRNRAPGITRGDIDTVLGDPDAVYDRGERTLVVGDDPDTPHDVVLTVVSGAIVSATSGEYVDDPLGERVLHDRNDEHPVRGRDRADGHDEIEATISDPDEVWENDQAGRRTYLKRIDGRWLAVDVGEENGVWTVLTAVDRGDSYSEVEDRLERRGYDVPGDQIYAG
jgi:hypothetical protein